MARGRERGDAGGFATVRALADLHVVEVGGDVAAAYCTRLLADLGVDVVKVEPPHGDPLRWWGPFRALNTSRRNVHASLSESTGADAFLELVRGADLVVERAWDRERSSASDSDHRSCPPRTVSTVRTATGR